MSTPIRRAIRITKFAVAPSVRSRLNKMTKDPVLRQKIVRRAKAIGVASHRETVIARLDEQLKAIHKQIDAISNKKGMESRRGKLITQTFALQKRLIALRKRAK